MRELKFRAWVFYGKRLKKPRYSDNDWLYRFFEDCNEDDADEFGEPQCIEQYTGLKDKNGKEIYEGDIVRCSFGESGVVELRHGAYCVVGDDITDMSNWKESAFEVIGNIHENGDLLND